MGVHKAIANPEILWKLFEEYRKDVKDNPRYSHEFVGKDGNPVLKPLERPLTMEGFELFVFEKGIASMLDQYFANREGRYSDFVSICSRIRQAIRRDQIEGGMVGQYNASITQRLNGLKEQQDNSGDMTITVVRRGRSDTTE
jgi:hypothetical protein